MDPQHTVTRRRRKPSVARLAHGSSSGSSSLAPGEQGNQCHAGISREVAPCLRITYHCMDKCECYTVRFTRKVRSMTARSIKTLLRAHDRLVGVTGIDAYFRRSPALGSLTALCFLSHNQLIIYLTEESWTTSLVRATCSPPLPASTLSSQEPVSLATSRWKMSWLFGLWSCSRTRCPSVSPCQRLPGISSQSP